MRPFVVAAAALLLSTGCLFPLSGLSEGRVVRTDVGDFLLKWQPEHNRDPQRTAAAIERANKQLLRWGKLNKAVTLYLMPSHFRLESAVGRFGYDWLRAWARYDEVYLQTPSTWDVADAELEELVLHELTHSLMYQRSATEQTWPDKQIPVWFREGMATWTANQGYRWPALEDLARFYEKNPGSDPIAAPDALYKTQSEVVYAAAHHGFTFLIRRHGQEVVPRLMDTMSAGSTFPEAFEKVTGITSAAFAREFRHYVIWRGFRGHGKPKLLP